MGFQLVRARFGPFPGSEPEPCFGKNRSSRRRHRIDPICSRFGKLPLTWSTRMKIALDAAKSLAFLHGEAEPPVIFRNFNPSKILLDADYNAKLTGFGLAIVLEGDKSLSAPIRGTIAYAASEWMMRGHFTIKSDVYGFGVVLFEILTGRKPYYFTDDGLFHSDGLLLVDYVRSHLEEERSLYELIDSRLGNQFSGKGAQIALQLAVRCLEMDPDARPWMSEVLESFENYPRSSIHP